jgi:hypothetical protein
MSRRGRKTYGFSFSWKRAAGISGMKNRISRRTGVPLTRAGRQRKVGRLLGCCVPLAAAGAAILLVLGGVAALARWVA